LHPSLPDPPCAGVSRGPHHQLRPATDSGSIHRVGCTGRMGSRGRASTLVSGAEIGDLCSMERATKVENRSPAIGGRHANTATGSPEHLSNGYAVPSDRRSILVNSTELRNAYNQCVSHVRDGSIFPSRMVGRRHNSRLPSPALS
jgi:superfamily II DNA/RNA helicase